MNRKILNVALGIVLAATTISASAQKNYTYGTISYTTQMRGQQAAVNEYFTPDSSAILMTMGPAKVKVLSNNQFTYFAVVLDIPIASIKKAGIATPAELEQIIASYPTFAFTPTTETKQISGFNCKKVIAKDTKSGKTYDTWITNDIAVPSTGMLPYYSAIGGFPVQFTTFQQGQEISITISSVSDQKAPAGTFAISKDFEKGTLADLNPGG